MPKYRVVMTDTITIRRTFSVVQSFPSLAAAKAWGQSHRGHVSAYADGNEKEIDNTPWEISVEKVPGNMADTCHKQEPVL